MKEADIKKIFLALAVANRHPDPEAYATAALDAWKNPPAPAGDKKGE